MRTTLRAPFVALAAGLFVVAACGDSGGPASLEADSGTATGGDTGATTGSDAPADLVAAVADGIMESGGLAVVRSEAECLARGVVDAIGEDDIAKAGFAAGAGGAESLADADIDISPRAITDLEDAFNTCLDLAALIVSGVGAELGVDAESIPCLAAATDTAEVAAGIVDAFVTGGDAFATGEELGTALVSNLDDACSEDVFLAAGVGAGDLTEAEAVCLGDELDDSVAAAALRAQTDPTVDADAVRTALRSAADACDVVL